MGLTGKSTVRLSDDFANAGTVSDREQPFLLTASNGLSGAMVFQNQTELATRGPLSERRLNTPWVIGQQGDIDGEYWTGEIAELRVYDRELSELERAAIRSEILSRYHISPTANATNLTTLKNDPLTLAWSSLCLVLMNSNEFVYVD